MEEKGISNEQHHEKANSYHRTDLCRWITENAALDTPLNPTDYLDQLQNGVILCTLAQCLQEVSSDYLSIYL